MKIFTAIIEKCPDTGLYVSYVPGFAGAHTQAESLDELQKNLREAIKLLICNAGVRISISPSNQDLTLLLFMVRIFNQQLLFYCGKLRKIFI